MRVKRYLVDSMPDAMQKIRSELGKNAVILQTKEIRSGGFLGMFSKKKIEVIAATDSSSTPQTHGFPPPKEADASTMRALASAVSAAKASISAASREKPQEPAAKLPDLPAKLPDPPAKATEDPVLQEIRSMKQMMLKLASSGGSAGLDPELATIERRLLEQEVHPALAEEIIRSIGEEAAAAGEPLTSDFAIRAAKDRLRRLFPADRLKTLAPDTRIAHFVGPTGVGKTTTIAKLAAEQALKYRRKVGFITSDTYRIGAVDQLKTFAGILNVPLEVVSSPLDLRKSFDALKDCDIIFTDTAGRNYRNEMYVSELNALLQGCEKSETYLVLSMTTKYKDMRAIAANFAKFELNKVLFTKMDETDTYGPIVNLLHEFPLQISYVTNGQSVPDDIKVADEDKIIALIMEEQAHE